MPGEWKRKTECEASWYGGGIRGRAWEAMLTCRFPRIIMNRLFLVLTRPERRLLWEGERVENGGPGGVWSWMMDQPDGRDLVQGFTAGGGMKEVERKKQTV